MKKNIIYLGVSLFLVSCHALKDKQQDYTVVSMQGERILVTETKNPDKRLEKIVSEYKVELDKEMNVVIGTSAQDMPYRAPESLLTNLTSDVMRQLDTTYTHGAPIDLAVMNVNGHRASMPKGDITVGSVFEIYSFDNELTIVKLKGSDVVELFKDYAKMKGAGISSNAKLIITKDGKLVDAILDGKLVDNDKIYTIVTLDYLADGNDGFETFKKALSVEKPGVILRDYMMDYVKSQTKAGKPVESKLDERISIQ